MCYHNLLQNHYYFIAQTAMQISRDVLECWGHVVKMDEIKETRNFFGNKLEVRKDVIRP
jgi:hypothetical protein